MSILKMFGAGLFGLILVAAFMAVTRIPQVYASLDGEFIVKGAQDVHGNWMSSQEAIKLTQSNHRYSLVSVSADWTCPPSN